MAHHLPPVDGPCLRYPENLGLHTNVTYETAVSMLLRALNLSQQVPYVWAYIDKPPGAFLVFPPLGVRRWFSRSACVRFRGTDLPCLPHRRLPARRHPVPGAGNALRHPGGEQPRCVLFIASILPP